MQTKIQTLLIYQYITGFITKANKIYYKL